ncbi:MAG: class I SAM-dependent methyltransferase [bacterium]
MTIINSRDKHHLYQISVQDPEAEMDFVFNTFSEIRGREPIALREDFCGTAYSSSHWVQRGEQNTAVGLDLDGEVLDWGMQNNVLGLSEDQQSRIKLLQKDVMKAPEQSFDTILAMNFSYYLFMDRSTMLSYFQKVRSHLVEDGIFFLDSYGGYDAPREIEETRHLNGFSYIWDQASYDPLTGRMQCYIHFTFENGDRMDKAFSYVWRLWTLPELQELLKEAGFSRVSVYWEQTDPETGEGNGEFKVVTQGEADAGWISYIVAER